MNKLEDLKKMQSMTQSKIKFLQDKLGTIYKELSRLNTITGHGKFRLKINELVEYDESVSSLTNPVASVLGAHLFMKKYAKEHEKELRFQKAFLKNLERQISGAVENED